MARFLHNRIPESVPWALTQQKGEWHEGAHLDRQIRIAGKGLLAGQDITKETIITRYIGTKIAKNKASRIGARNAYICSLNDRYDIDGNTLKTKPAISIIPVIPNCVLQTTSRAIWVVAVRDIQAGEELTSVQL